jgi:hypothetical protein
MIKVIRIPSVRLVTPTTVRHTLSVELLSMNILVATCAGIFKPIKLLHLIFHVTTSARCRLMFGYQRISRLIMIKSNVFPMTCVVAGNAGLIWIVFRG